MQLVAYGAQDIYLTGNPQITFFKVVYRRHTNFSVESIKQTFNGTNSFGNTVTATISRNGDLVTNMYLQFQLPALDDNVNLAGGGTDDSPAYVNEVGNALIEEVELEIGGQRIDKHYSEWLSIWSELNLTQSQKGEDIHQGYNAMVGRATDNATRTKLQQLFDAALGEKTDGNGDSDRTYYVPLRFWFNRNPGLALPLIALQYHEVKVRMKLRALGSLVQCLDNGLTTLQNITSSSNLVTAGGASVTLKNAGLWVDYVYLDTDERRRFAQVSHEYLIEQLQEKETTVSSATTSVSLNFNHPVKELVWAFVRADRATEGFATASTGNGMLDFVANTPSNTNANYPLQHFGTATLKLNGHERFEERDASYFNLVQPYQHHTSAPSRKVYVYSFALKPEEHQPSGTCNFSRIDNAQLELKTVNLDNGGSTQNLNLKLYAVNYNVLRIMSGMGGLAYSN
jgi:hypothetical protein